MSIPFLLYSPPVLLARPMILYSCRCIRRTALEPTFTQALGGVRMFVYPESLLSHRHSRPTTKRRRNSIGITAAPSFRASERRSSELSQTAMDGEVRMAARGIPQVASQWTLTTAAQKPSMVIERQLFSLFQIS